jgi:hypothetical protein
MDSSPPDKKMPPPWAGDIEREVQKKLWPARLKAIRDSALPALTIGVVLIIGYLRFSGRLNIFGAAVSGYWVGLLSGSGGTVVLLLIEKFVLKVPISKAWYAVTLMGFMFFGCFQAWEKEYTSRVGREMDLISANGDRDKWKALAGNVSSSAAEPQYSLRRRTMKLADDIDQFFVERKETHPPYTNGIPDAIGRQGEVNRKSDEYDQETARQCMARFGDQIIGVPRELRNKGLNVRYLDRNDPPRCLSPAAPDTPYESDTDILRYLAYMLDANDRVVHFMPTSK